MEEKMEKCLNLIRTIEYRCRLKSRSNDVTTTARHIANKFFARKCVNKNYKKKPPANFFVFFYAETRI